MEPEFINLDDYRSLSEFHHSGGILFDGLEVFVERNYRTPLKRAILKSWVIGSVKMDITGYGKYSESTTRIFIDDKLQSWPFTMLYVKK